jgi:hypothetical protein
VSASTPRTNAARVAAALFAAALLAPAPAGADLAACKKAYEDQRFEEALPLCGKVAREPMAERHEVTAALEVVGMASLVLGRDRPARTAFCQLLVTDPEHRPTDPIYPQRFVAVFDATRKAGCGPMLRLEMESASHRTQAAVRLRARGPLPAVSRLGVFYRQAGDKRWRRELAMTTVSATVELPRVSLADADVEVFATVLVDDDHAVARAGSVDRPLRLARVARTTLPDEPPVRPSRDVPIWKRAWFWWAVAGVAATVVIVSVSVAATRSDGAGGTLGSIQLPLRLTWR